MATKLKVVEQVADIVPAPTLPEFDPAPTRNQHSGWTAERQRKSSRTSRSPAMSARPAPSLGSHHLPPTGSPLRARMPAYAIAAFAAFRLDPPGTGERFAEQTGASA